eukprot:4551120-Pleurochrysis_carterae.AAC.1
MHIHASTLDTASSSSLQQHAQWLLDIMSSPMLNGLLNTPSIPDPHHACRRQCDKVQYCQTSTLDCMGCQNKPMHRLLMRLCSTPQLSLLTT